MTAANHPVLVEYDRHTVLFEEFRGKLERLLAELLGGEQGIHSIGGRVKERPSLHRKLDEDKQGRFKSLDDVFDILGLRVITYLEDQVKAVSSVIEREFDIDPKLSSDRQQRLGEDRFGYRSVHYVVRLPRTRVQLAEYQAFAPYRFEIQVRSILQHAWAEIEHDLGYKPIRPLPLRIKRDLSRVAGLLELADMEFLRIRDEAERSSARGLGLVSVPASESFWEFIRAHPLVRRLDEDIARLQNAVVRADPPFVDYIGAMFIGLNLDTFEGIDEALRNHTAATYRFAELWQNQFPNEGESVLVGTSLLNLALLLAGVVFTNDEIVDFVEGSGLSFPAEEYAAVPRLAAQALADTQ